MGRRRAVMGKPHPQTEPEHSHLRVYVSEWHVTHHNLVVSINLQKVQNCLAKISGNKKFQNTYFLMPMKGWLMDWLQCSSYILRLNFCQNLLFYK